MSVTRRQIWWILGVETLFLLVLAAWVLSRLDRLLEPAGLLIALAIIVLGDLATALLMQRFAPTRITLAPGEGVPMLGEAISDFGGEIAGRVLVRGERWEARCTGLTRISAGDSVRVVSRGGLTLLVEPVD
jgi:membrane-bound ClpP family serine protease